MSVLSQRSLIPLLLVPLVLIPHLSLAQGSLVEFTEVMADPEGADDNREWVRIHNVSGAPLDILSWRFSEGGVNHKIKPETSSVIPADGYAVIADDAATYRQEHQAVNDLIFDSTFALKNSGGTVALKNASSTVMAEMSYTPVPKSAKAPKTTTPKTKTPKATPQILTRATSSLAAAGVAQDTHTPSFLPWLLGALALAVVGGVAVFAVTKPKGTGYEIIDTSEELL